jgi:hypothetical protein
MTITRWRILLSIATVLSLVFGVPAIYQVHQWLVMLWSWMGVDHELIAFASWVIMFSATFAWYGLLFGGWIHKGFK